jgi:hypothetical protein
MNTTNYPLRSIWNLYRYPLQKEWGNRKYCTGHPIWLVKLKEEIGREIWNNLNDTKRRGQSNREGSRNRRWRKHQLTQPRVLFSVGLVDFVA